MTSYWLEAAVSVLACAALGLAARRLFNRGGRR